MPATTNIYFSDFFNIDPDLIEDYGAFNVSLINDLPLFIDPFLLFGSKSREYQTLHKSILDYLKFLKHKAQSGNNGRPQIQSWYVFPEIKQNWFGYSRVGNKGRGLGLKFGRAFSSSINIVFDDLGKEKVTESSHLEKAALFETGVGKDNISDFTANLIKNYLLEYTQTFALANIDKQFLKKVNVDKAYFDYKLERWMPKEFTLPYIFRDYVLLTPKNILTKDDSWINYNDLRGDFTRICNSIPNAQLRNEITNYFHRRLPPTKKGKHNTQKELTKAIHETIRKFPEIIKWFIKYKEANKSDATSISKKRVAQAESIFINRLQIFVKTLLERTEFYNVSSIGSYEESLQRIMFLKQVIENNDGYKLFYVDGNPIKREEDLQVIYRLTWFASDFDVNREPNNGRGPVDYAISMGASDKTLVEFKLASNSKLKQNLKKQVKIYEEANRTKKSIKAILYFDDSELQKVQKILKELKLEQSDNIVLIDARRKISASNVT